MTCKGVRARACFVVASVHVWNVVSASLGGHFRNWDYGEVLVANEFSTRRVYNEPSFY